MLLREYLVLMTALAGAMVGVMPGVAFAEVTIGANVNSFRAPDFPQNSPTCAAAGGCAGVQQTLSGRRTTAPFDGVIVRWRVRGVGTFAIFAAPYRGDDTVVRGQTSANGIALSHNRVTAFRTRLPIARGSFVGFIARFQAEWKRLVPVAGADLDAWSPVPASGVSTRAQGPDLDSVYPYNADIEPDADRDGYGDETQDGCPTNATTQGPCPPPSPPVSPPPSPQPPPTPSPDTAAPRFITKPTIRPATLRGRRRASLRFTLSEPARVQVVFARVVRRGRERRVSSIVRRAAAGPNTFRLSTRLGTRRLRSGRYRVTLRATDDAGNVGRALIRLRVR